MNHEMDYKKAYETLDKATREAIHTLSQARLQALLRLQIDSGELTAEDEPDDEAGALVREDGNNI